MNNFFQYHPFTTDDIRNFLSKRQGETKLGEVIQLDPFAPEVDFVVIGIEESIGTKSNLGNGGAENGFSAFLKRFLNMQSNRFLSGQNVAIAGSIKSTNAFENYENGRKMVEILDDFASRKLKELFDAGKKVILIGGGHNNAYPLIKALKLSSTDSINVINLDPHSDCRALEGRHSGNSFSYAIEEDLLDNYSVIGLHRPYNSEYLLDYLDKRQCFYSFFEDYVSEVADFVEDVKKVREANSQKGLVGIELDLDSIVGMPSSAYTPSGFSVEQARYYISEMAQLKNCRYLHLPEAAPTNEKEELITGKTLAYLVWDFIFYQQSTEKK